MASNLRFSIPEGTVSGTRWNLTTIAPPLLIYADLMATADPRNLEAAKQVYGLELIDGLFRTAGTPRANQAGLVEPIS